jgi:hypothetical protein
MSKVIDDQGIVREVKDNDNRKARGVQNQALTLNVQGGSIGIALGLLALGAVVVAAIILPQLMEARAKAAVSEAIAPIQAKVAAQETTTYFAERESKLAREHVAMMEHELAARGLIKNLPH